MTRKIFLDLGAYIGDSVRFFREECEKAKEFEIFCFEPSPKLISKLEKVSNITLIKAAAWSSNGTAFFYLGRGEGSTMYKDKTSAGIDPKNVIKVSTVDIAKFIKSNFNKSDKIWVKMNIEGGEYEIIPHLKKQGLLEWFDRVFVKWHSRKIPSLVVKDDEVRKMIPEAIPFWRGDLKHNPNIAKFLKENPKTKGLL